MTFTIDGYPTPPVPSPGPAPTVPGTKPAAPAPTNTTPAPPPKLPDANVIADALKAGMALKAGDAIRSANGQYELVMQKDGNLVVYANGSDKAIWSSNTQGSGANFARMGDDGNLVLLKDDKPVWVSKTAGHAGASLTMQDDGNVVLRAQANPGDKAPAASLWSTNTAAFTSGAPDPNPGGTPPIPGLTPDQLASVGMYKPGLAELGLTQYTLGPGDTPGSIIDAHTPPGTNVSLDQALAATPFLDRQAFGTRAANPADAVNSIPDGKQITVLDSTRLDMLEQQRKDLAAAEQADNPHQYQQKTQALVATIGDELDYAGSQQAVPDPKALADSIRARAPQDKTFGDAVDAAVAIYANKLDQDGRSPDQLGQIAKAAASGDWKQVHDLAMQQVSAAAGNDKGSPALGDMLHRGGVYLTYAGGDPKFAQAVQSGINDAQTYVLHDKPINDVTALHDQGKDAEAMAALKAATDPQTAMPGQVAKIVSDPKIQAFIKDALHSANWRDSGTRAMLSDLATVCQSATEADQGHPGVGRQAVNDIADQLISVYQNIDTYPHSMGDPSLPAQLFKSTSANGDVALSLAVATRANQQGQSGIAATALDGARAGIEAFGANTDKLNKQTAKDAQFIGIPLQDWGGNSTPDEQKALIEQLLAEHPDEAKQLNKDGLDEAAQQLRYNSMRMALESYSPALNGIEGFNVDVNSERAHDPTMQTHSTNLKQAFDALPKFVTRDEAAENDTSGNSPSTNTLWMQRSTRNAVWQAATGFAATDPSKLPASLRKFSINEKIPDAVKSLLFSTDGKGLSNGFNTAFKRMNSGYSSYLFLQNGAAVMQGFGAEPHSAINWIEDGTYAYQHNIMGASQGMSALLPQAWGKIRPGSGQTIVAMNFDRLRGAILGSDMSDGAKRALTRVAGAAFRDTVDVAYLGIDLANTIAYSETAQSAGDVEHAVGEGLSTLGDVAFLMGAGQSAATTAEIGSVGADTFLALGEGAVGWTGVGAALMLAGAGVYTIGSAENHSHKFDTNDQELLQAMGVRQDVAGQLAKHLFSTDEHAPTAGTFLTAYFKYSKVPQKGMVDWLNTLTPKQADEMASALKVIDGDWQKRPMSEMAQRFDNALLQYGLMPPIELTAGQ